MKYTKQEVEQFVNEEDVKFIRLAYCDIYGRQKNISIMPSELARAFKYGISIDAWSVTGFNIDVKSDIFLHPDPSTLSILPWRPDHGRVVRMFCDITWSDGSKFAVDCRSLLKKAIEEAREAGVEFNFSSEIEFYLFKKDADGNITKDTFDEAGYMDIAPFDKGENIRREICITLERMGITPESSHHEEGPGQNEIDFRFSDPLSAADNAITFKNVVKTVANLNGVYADFSPKPIPDKPGNGMHINFSIVGSNGISDAAMSSAVAGILKNIDAMTLFLNPSEDSYKRLGRSKSPQFICWGRENRSELIRIPAAEGEYVRAELRSPDPSTNPYLAYTLLIYAMLDGIKNNLVLDPESDVNMYHASLDVLKNYGKLPASLTQAKEIAKNSDFIKKYLPEEIINFYVAK